MDGAPKGLKALGGTPESYYTTLIFFVISILLCFQAISDVAGTADEWSSMLLSLFFLVCASSWLCKQVRDRADVNNEMWEKDVSAAAPFAPSLEASKKRLHRRR